MMGGLTDIRAVSEKLNKQTKHNRFCMVMPNPLPQTCLFGLGLVSIKQDCRLTDCFLYMNSTALLS